MRLARRSSQSRAKIHREAFIFPVSAWGVLLALLLLTPSAGQADCEYFRPYPKDYNTCLEREKAERATQQREWLYRQTQRRQQEQQLLQQQRQQQQQEQLRQQQQQKQEALEREQQKEAEERAFRQRQLDLMSQQMEQQRAYQQRQLQMQQQQHDLNCNVFGYGNRSYSIRCN